MVIVLLTLIASITDPVSHPASAPPTTNATPDSTTPNNIDTATSILGSNEAATGNPKMPPAIFNPITPPINDPGSNPTSANSTRPAPTPTYNPFLAASVVFIFLYLLFALCAASVYIKAFLMPTTMSLILKESDCLTLCIVAKQEVSLA